MAGTAGNPFPAMFYTAENKLIIHGCRTCVFDSATAAGHLFCTAGNQLKTRLKYRFQ